MIPKLNTSFLDYLLTVSFVKMALLGVSLLLALAQHAAAHGIVTKIVAGTKTYQGYDPNFQYMPTPPPTIGWAAPATQDRGPVDGTKLGFGRART